MPSKDVVIDKIFISKVKNKKYSVYVKDPSKKSGVKLVSFGDKRYGHFRDKTPLKAYSYLDHNDSQRRAQYYARHGEKSIRDKTRPKYWSHRFLW